MASVYIVQAGDVYKIGWSINLPSRLRAIQSILPTPIVLIKAWETAHARLVECYLHRRFQAAQVRGEWFTLTAPEIQALISVNDWPLDVIQPPRPPRVAIQQCGRCGYRWQPHSNTLPPRCAKCRSAYWNGDPLTKKGDLLRCRHCGKRWIQTTRGQPKRCRGCGARAWNRKPRPPGRRPKAA